MLSPSSRISNIEMGFAKFFSMRKPEMVDLSVGEPGFDTPAHIKEAAYKSMTGGNIRYAPPLGNEDLREAISQKYREEYGVDSTKDNVMISHGAKGIIYALMQSLVQRGDEVIVQDPGWVSYTEIVKLAEGTPVPANANSADEFAEDVERKITPKTKMIIFSTPSNPTGEVYNESALKKLAEIAKDKNVLLVSDEPYHKIIFDESRHISPGKFGLENVAVVNSFSKTYAMSGWRIGYIIAENYIVEGMKKVQMHQCTSVAPFTQAAAKHALMNDREGIEERRQIYKRRRDLFVNSLSKKLKGKIPQATFYYFATTDGLGMDGKTLVEKLIQKNVLAVPGYLFGKYAQNAVRFSFAKEEEQLKIGAERINEVVENLAYSEPKK